MNRKLRSVLRFLGIMVIFATLMFGSHILCDLGWHDFFHQFLPGK